LKLFFAFFKMGLFTIGGGIAMVPLMERIVVDEKKWLNEKEMTDCITVSQSMPGVIAVNAATYIGKKKEGFAGAVVSTVGVVLPSFIIIILIVSLLGTIGDNKYVEGAFKGIKATVCGLIIVTTLRMGKNVLKDWFGWTIAILAFLIIVFLKVTVIWIIIAGALLGVIYTFFIKKEGC